MTEKKHDEEEGMGKYIEDFVNDKYDNQNEELEENTQKEDESDSEVSDLVNSIKADTKDKDGHHIQDTDNDEKTSEFNLNHDVSEKPNPQENTSHNVVSNDSVSESNGEYRGHNNETTSKRTGFDSRDNRSKSNEIYNKSNKKKISKKKTRDEQKISSDNDEHDNEEEFVSQKTGEFQGKADEDWLEKDLDHEQQGSFQEKDKIVNHLDRVLRCDVEEINTRTKPKASDKIPGLEGIKDKRTQDKVSFKKVTDDGLILSENGGYIGLVRIKSVPWHVKPIKTRQRYIDAFAQVIMALDFPIHIYVYPRKFDVDEHLEHLYDAHEKAKEINEHPLIRVGREKYMSWLKKKIEKMDIREYEFYVAVKADDETLRKSHTNKGWISKNTGLTPKQVNSFKQKIPIVNADPVLEQEDDESRVKKKKEEVEQRLTQISAMMKRIPNSGTEVVTSKETLKEILDYVYNQDGTGEKDMDYTTFLTNNMVESVQKEDGKNA